ncbi:hypothetical protein C8R44DRAFT_780849 [Mycena epipterygia]|nr:hypothetical protein C8R44DRAFT_780849 [Mycena epipterygia]
MILRNLRLQLHTVRARRPALSAAMPRTTISIVGPHHCHQSAACAPPIGSRRARMTGQGPGSSGCAGSMEMGEHVLGAWGRHRTASAVSSFRVAGNPASSRTSSATFALSRYGLGGTYVASVCAGAVGATGASKASWGAQADVDWQRRSMPPRGVRRGGLSRGADEDAWTQDSWQTSRGEFPALFSSMLHVASIPAPHAVTREVTGIALGPISDQKL